MSLGKQKFYGQKKESKYSLLELLFANKYQWVRKRAKCIWIKDLNPGSHWVKFSNKEIEDYISYGVNLTEPSNDRISEDWR